MAGAPVCTSFSDAAAVTPSDTTVYSPPLQALFVGGTGNLTVITQAGNSVLLTAVPAAATVPLLVKQVMATGTTATNITGFK